MTYGFKAYIDESGCEGGRHGEGATEWFSLSAVVTKAHAETSEPFARFNELARKPADYRPKKYQTTSAKNKILLTRALGEHQSFRVAHILVHKPSLTSDSLKTDHTRLYKYVTRFLIERISWICRDAEHPPENPLCRITLSERRGFPYNEVRGYVTNLRAMPSCRIHWDHIQEDLIGEQKHDKSDGCRLADVAASSITHAVEYTDQQITDDRPIRWLRDITYRPAQTGQLRGNGIKIFPWQAESLINTDDRLAWLLHHYPE